MLCIRVKQSKQNISLFFLVQFVYELVLAFNADRVLYRQLAPENVPVSFVSAAVVNAAVLGLLALEA